MDSRIALDRYHATEIAFDLEHNIPLRTAQRFRDFRIDPENHLIIPIDIFRDAATIGLDLVADSLRAFDHPAATAILAGSAKRSFERLLDPLAGDRHQSEIVELKNLRGRAVAPKLLFQCLHDFLPVAPFFHIDKVEDNNPAQIAQPNLADDLFCSFEVRLNDCVLKPVRFADELSGIDIDRHQSFSLIDHDISTRFQPDPRFDSFIDLILHAVLFKNRYVFGVEFDPIDQFGSEAVNEIDDPLIFELIVDPDCIEIRR